MIIDPEKAKNILSPVEHNTRDHTTLLLARQITPFYSLSIIVISIIAVEALIMFILERLPPFSSSATIVIDSLFLIVLLSPVLYFFMLRPMFLEFAARKQTEEDIREQKKFLDTVIESIPHPFYVISTDDYTLKLTNPAADLSTLGETLTTCHGLLHNKNIPCGEIGYICPLEKVSSFNKIPQVVSKQFPNQFQDNSPVSFKTIPHFFY